MLIHIRRFLVLVFVCGCLVVVSASPPVIGVAQSAGVFRVNHASVPGSATIFEGASLETGVASSKIDLKTGQRLLLASTSAAEIHQDRLVLSKGSAELSGAADYRIDTGKLSIGATDRAASIRVAIDAANQVRVNASGGRAEVRNHQGVLLAQVSPGSTIQVPNGAETPAKYTGVLREQKGKYLLTDDTSKVTVELRGKNLARLKGKHVQVIGVVLAGEGAAAGASLVVSVSSAATAAAAAGTAAAGAGAATASGMSAGTIVVIGGAAAAGATVGGLYAADVIGGNETPTSR
jgi:hypothetical protein